MKPAHSGHDPVVDGVRRSLLGAATAAVALGSGAARAFAESNVPLRIVVPYQAGGSADIVGRNVGRWLGERTGRPVIIDNRAGAGASVGTEYVAHAQPDGNTLLLHTGTLAVETAAGKKLPYDLHKDLAPVGMIAAGPFALMVNPQLAAHSVAELIALCKSSPGKLNFASAGIGTSAHMSMELFKAMAGIDVVHIPYKGGSPALNAVIAGDAQMLIDPLFSAKSFNSAGKVRALAVTTRNRTDLWPELPTIAETVPGYETTVWYGLSATGGTPAAVLNQISGNLRAVVAQHDNKAWLQSQGLEPVGDTPVDFTKRIDREIQIWSTLIQQTGITIE